MLKKLFLLAVLLSVMMGAAYKGYKFVKYYKEPVPEAVEIGSVIEAAETSLLTATPSLPPSETLGNLTEAEAVKTLPPSLNLKMPFYSQAPFGDWSLPWQEACEEASVLLIANVYLEKNWTREEFNEQILRLVEWQKQRFGDYEHTSIEQTAAMMEENFGLNTIIHENPSQTQVKEILNKGHLIIMTFAGKQLENPFYKNGGPVYHAMVIKGYKEGQKIITHDVGTKRGEDYVYSWNGIQRAMHDYAVPIENGAKRMIEIIPN